MLYSLCECENGTVKRVDYNDWDEVLRNAIINTNKNAFSLNYWCKIFAQHKDGETECFYSVEAWALAELYTQKAKMNKELAESWVRDEIFQFGKHKIKAYTKYMEFVYG